jgi:SAM-dependent methyltransferase
VRHLGLSGDRLIDAGCGTGRWSFAFATRFTSVFGFDSSPLRIATAIWLKNRFDLPGVDFIEGDVRDVPAPDCSADVIYSNSVAPGWVPLETILAEWFRVLRPGGVCFIGLNGPGYAYYMLGHADSAFAAHGRNRLYNDTCQWGLRPLIPSIAPGGPMSMGVRAVGGLDGGPAALLRYLAAPEAQVAAAEKIERVLGPDFARTLGNDLVAIAEGGQMQFSHADAGRGYEPDELRETARAVGFSRFEWALDGFLSLQPDGSVRKAPAATARPSMGEVAFAYTRR